MLQAKTGPWWATLHKHRSLPHQDRTGHGELEHLKGYYCIVSGIGIGVFFFFLFVFLALLFFTKFVYFQSVTGWGAYGMRCIFLFDEHFQGLYLWGQIFWVIGFYFGLLWRYDLFWSMTRVNLLCLLYIVCLVLVLYGWAWLDWTFFTLITVMIFMQIHISELSELLIFSFVT